MSDDDRDIDIESDDDEVSLSPNAEETRNGSTLFVNQIDKRAHHNALERKRRDHIKDSFSNLRDCIPLLKGEKASRAQILKKTADYIHNIEKRNNVVVREIEELKRKNKLLEQEIQRLERSTITSNFAAATVKEAAIKKEAKEFSDSDSSEIEETPTKKRKHP